MKDTAKQNYLWGRLIVEELVRNGVDYFCIAPGSRSTPLTVAAAENKRAKTFIHFDERALAFHALGYASARRGGVAVITTSGSAVANLLPAIVEASKKKLPIIILTADRPPELRNTGANQTIDQVKIFGSYVRWDVDLPTPTDDIQAEYVLTTVDQAVFRSQGELPGPVHINCMFREPFLPETLQEPLPDLWKKEGAPFTVYQKGEMQLEKEQTKTLVDKILSIPKGVLVVGKLRSSEEEELVLKLAEQLQWPIFADITSGLRWGKDHPLICTHFDQVLGELSPEVTGVIQLGGRMTSKRFYQWLKKQDLQEYMMVLKHPLRNDPLHNVTTRVQSSVKEFCSQVSPLLSASKKGWAEDLLAANQRIKESNAHYFQKNNDLSEVGVVYTLATHFPENNALFLSSSLPIREMDRFADGEDLDVPLSANRGASGIDGIISSAIGYSQGLDQPVTLLIGDLAFLYDINALAMLESSKHPLTVIVVNNNGGGIFNFLSVSKHEKIFESYFGTPHNLSMEHTAGMFKLNCVVPKDLTEFSEAIQNICSSTIIEVNVNRADNVREQNDIQNQARLS